MNAPDSHRYGAQAANAMEQRGSVPQAALPPSRSLGRPAQVVSPFSATTRPVTTAPLRQVYIPVMLSQQFGLHLPHSIYLNVDL